MSKKRKYYQRPDGLYEAIRIVNGKRKAFRGHTEAEVERKMIAYAAELERGRLFREVADEWEDAHFPELAPNTLRAYRPALRRAVDRFGDVPIRNIKAPDVKRFLVDFAGKGAAAMSQHTVNNQLLLVSLVMGYAAEIGEIEYNPCTNVTAPKGLGKTHREAASTEDEAKIKAVGGWLFPFLVLYTGLRKGEALALTYGDIDDGEDVIHVTKSVYHEANRPRIKRPKTEAGARDVPILDPLRARLPKSRDKSLYIFSEDGGKTPLSETQYQRLWSSYVAETGISCTAHQLRHSYATMLFECGVELKDAQDLLGHSTAAMTQDIYTHIRDARRKSTAELLNKKLKELNTNTQNTQ